MQPDAPTIGIESVKLLVEKYSDPELALLQPEGDKIFMLRHVDYVPKAGDKLLSA